LNRKDAKFAKGFTIRMNIANRRVEDFVESTLAIALLIHLY